MLDGIVSLGLHFSLLLRSALAAIRDGYTLERHRLEYAGSEPARSSQSVGRGGDVSVRRQQWCLACELPSLDGPVAPGVTVQRAHSVCIGGEQALLGARQSRGAAAQG